MLKNKNYISTARVPIVPKPGRMVAIFNRILPKMSHGALITWPCYKSRYKLKLKPFYLHNHNAYSHKTWQDTDLA